MENIISYIKKTYDPLAIIAYGSYADGSNNAGSDFDALVISRSGEQFHDVSFVDGIQLDVFVYPARFFEEEFDPAWFVQTFDGKIILDTDGIAQRIKDGAAEHIAKISAKTPEEIRDGVDWCVKMAQRVRRGDAEGMFRWHWLLKESLEIFCDAKRRAYLGPKKSLRWMQAEYPDEYAAYARALAEFNLPSLDEWIECLKKQAE